MKWSVEIQKTILDKRNLADLLQGIGFELVDGVEYPALHSPALDACETAGEVLEIAKEVQATFKGPAKIDTDFELGNVIEYTTTPPRRHAFFEVTDTVLTIAIFPPSITITPPKELSPAERERWNAEQAENQYQEKLEHQRTFLVPAYFNPKAAKLIELLAIENPSGVTLYKIYELAEGDKSNRETFQTKFGITKNSFNRFKDAVHNPAVSGDWARHASPSKLNSNNPMSKTEAKEFIHEIAIKWLKSIRQNY
jgi:hypothetical protein